MSGDITNPTSHNTNPLFSLPPDMQAGPLSIMTKMNIVQDTLQVPLGQLLNPASGGAVFGYSSNTRTSAEGPPLDRPRENVYTGLSSSTEAGDESIQTVLQSLISSLPEDVQALLTADPLTSAASALLNSLNLTAQFLAILDMRANVEDVSEVTANRTTLNEVLPFLALQGSLAIASETSDNVANSIDRNNPNYDYFSTALNNMQEPLAMLAAVSAAAAQSTNGVLPDSAKKLAAKAAEELATLASQMSSVQPRGGELGILLDTVESLQAVAAALSTSTPSLSLTLHTASIGLNTDDSVTGINGPTLAQTNAAIAYLTNAAIPDSTAGLQALFGNAVTILNDLVMSFSTLGVTPPSGTTPRNSPLFALPALLAGTVSPEPLSALCIGAILLLMGMTSQALFQTFGNFPTTNTADLPAAHFFSFQTLLNTIVGSDIIDSFYKSFIESTSKNEAGTAVLAPIFTMMSVVLIILAGVSYGRQSPEQLFEECSPTIHRGLVALKGLLEKDGSDTPKLSAAAVAVDEALQGIDTRDYSRLTAALSTFLDFAGSSYENLTKDVSTVRNAASVVARQVKENKTNDPTSGVMTVA